MPLPIHGQQNTELDVKTYQAGSAFSTEEQFIGSTAEGKYKDAINFRPNGNQQDEFSLEKIRGEVSQYVSADNSCNTYYAGNFATGDWKCLGTAYIKGYVVEMWADESAVLAPFIRIDGVIRAASPQLPLRCTFPIQYHWNHTCKGGEIYITDNDTPPIILNIQDMVDASVPVCTEKYFSEFDIRKYQVNIEIPPHHFQFIELTNNPGYPGVIIGSGGLKVGQYAYSFRYVTATGDRTGWLPTTPLIPVSKTVNNQSPEYPYIKTFGADPSEQSGFGCVLELRIDNKLAYDFIEIKRYSYNTGAPVGFTPSAELIGTYPLVPDQFGIATIVDLGGTGEPLTDEDDTEVGGPIQACKTLRYFENRLYLMNVRYATMDIQPTLVSNGRPNMFPVIQKTGTVGCNDAWFSTYNRAYFRGEKYGFSVGLYNTLMGRTFATPIASFTNYKMPERRDQLDALGQTFSYYGFPLGATYQFNLDGEPCFETYDDSDFIKKTDCCSFKNILCNGEKGDGCDTSEGINNMPAFCGTCENPSLPISVTDGRVGYRVLTPKGEADPDVNGHKYLINTRVRNECSGLTPFQPRAYGPSYYSLGMAFNGLDTSTLPSYIQAFTIARTRPAGRIVCQGIGMYYLYRDSSNLAHPCKKDTSRMWFYSWEATARAGLISQSQIDSIGANQDGRYHMQLVSPVGFFTEMPWFEKRRGIFPAGRDTSDLLVYGRFYYDQGGAIGINLNPTPTSNVFNYVRFGAWRNPLLPASAWITNLATDKASIRLNGFRPANNNALDNSGIGNEYVGDRGGEYFVIEADTATYGLLYSATGVGLNACDEEYESADAKNWHEPFYNVNIVDTLANVPQQDITEYFDTEAYQKLRSRIGIVTGAGSYRLVDERWEDVLPYVANNIPTGTPAEVDANTLNSIIEIVEPNGTVKYYLNVDGVGAGAVANLLTAVPFTITGASKNGVEISGVYTTTSSLSFGVRKNHLVSVTGLTPLPPNTSDVYCIYDNEVPIRVFGGDAYTGDDIFSPIDRKIPNGGGAGDNQGTESTFALNGPFPYNRFQVNPRMFIANQAKSASNKIQDCSEAILDWVRQMACIFNTESRIHVALAHESSVGNDFGVVLNKFFPATNYIMRPSNWDTSLSDNKCSNGGNVHDEYYEDYQGEDTIWRYGGYRYRPQYNIDYMHSNNILPWVNKPTTGYRELTEFCTRIAYSLIRDISAVDAPGIRTFLPQNVYDADDQTGEIKFAWNAMSGAGDNLYAFTDRGAMRLLTNKSVLADATGGTVGLASTEKVIGDEAWISRDIGMNVEMWRSRAEYDNVLYFANLTSSYRFENEALEDIGRNGYHAMLYNNYLRIINGDYSAPAGNGTYVTGVYDVFHNEYLLQVNIDDAPQGAVLFAYNNKAKAWNGRYAFNYDYYLSYDNILLGMGRDFDQGQAVTFRLDSGYQINNAPITARVVQVSAQKQILAKEFQGARIVSNEVPTVVHFYDDIQQQQAGTPQCSILAVNFRNYGNAWEQYIGRKNTAPNNRMQGVSMVFEVIHTGATAFKIVDTGIYWKPLI